MCNFNLNMIYDLLHLAKQVFDIWYHYFMIFHKDYFIVTHKNHKCIHSLHFFYKSIAIIWELVCNIIFIGPTHLFFLDVKQIFTNIFDIHNNQMSQSNMFLAHLKICSLPLYKYVGICFVQNYYLGWSQNLVKISIKSSLIIGY